jgi:hypothetical protein
MNIGMRSFIDDAMQDQAASLSEVVSVFRLDEHQRDRAAAANRPASINRAAAPLPPRPAKQAIAAPLRKPRTSAVALPVDNDWETF